MQGADHSKARGDPPTSSSDLIQCTQRQAVVIHMGCCSMSSIQEPTLSQPLTYLHPWQKLFTRGPTRPGHHWCTQVQARHHRQATQQAADAADDREHHAWPSGPFLRPPSASTVPHACHTKAANQLVCSSMCFTPSEELLQCPPALSPPQSHTAALAMPTTFTCPYGLNHAKPHITLPTDTTNTRQRSRSATTPVSRSSTMQHHVHQLEAPQAGVGSK